MRKTILTVVMCGLAFRLCAAALTDDSQIKTFLHDNFAGKDYGMVVGIIDEHGSRVFSVGKLGNGTSAEVNGDTVFEIGSITKTFTDLLLMDMVERGEMKLNDPVSKYLPASVRVPDYQGKPITLLNLAAQDSGLPFNPPALSGSDATESYNNFTVDDMFSFLSGHHLIIAPGAKFQYSNVGVSLLGHAIALKAGTNFESLVMDRICRPLHMDDSCFKIPDRLRARAAVGHAASGQRAPDMELQAYVPAGSLHSTVNDLLKYLSANLGLTHTGLQPLMEQMQVVQHRDSPDMGNTAIPWYDHRTYAPEGSEFLGHAGGTSGSVLFIGFDKKQRRGLVVLSNQSRIHSQSVGWRILQQSPLLGVDAEKMQPVMEIVGTGISLDMDQRTHVLRITKALPNTPAARADLKPGTILQKVDGTSTTGKTLPECLSLLRGPAGSKVQFELVTPDGRQTNTVELTREKIRI